MNQESIKYFAYLRKSSESEERQSLSIPAQKDKIKEYFSDLEIVEILEESHSAFKPYNRPVFSKMINRIRKGEAHGIISWHPDRISRNEIDAATITYMLREGKIKDLKFGSYTFMNTAEGIWMLQMALSQSQYYSAKLGTDVKRGLEKKLKMGWLPSGAPTGYLNYVNIEFGQHEIIKDPERFDLVRKMWDLMLTGNYNPTKILEIANNEWGFRTLKRRKRGGGTLARSSIYVMFTNPFYAGIISYKGNEYDGKHEPMITADEFDQVQILLGRKGKPRPKTHFFPFTGPIRCGECGCQYTAETKTKIIKSTQKIKSFTYYHCTRRKKEINCSQRKSLSKNELEKQIEKEIVKMTILPDFRKWALEVLNRRNDQEIEDRSKIFRTQQKTLTATQKELDNLTQMRYRDLIDDKEFLKGKTELKAKLAKLKEELGDTEKRAEKWLELTEETFHFVTYALRAFEQDNPQQKKEILAALGQNYVIKDGILKIEPNEWFVPIIERYPALEAEYKRLEPALAGVSTGSKDKETERIKALRLEWRARPDSNRRSPP